MFASSSQLKCWIFSGTTELKRLRNEAHENFIMDRRSVQPVRKNFVAIFIYVL